MAEPDSSITRRSFVEKVALAAGITAAGGGALLENLKPTTAQAATSVPPSGTDLMNSGAFGWDLTPTGRQAASAAAAGTPAPANLITNPNILMIVVDQLRLPQFWLTADQQWVVDRMCPNIAWLRNTSYYFTNFYACAQACTPSRANLLTGLYAPQTGVFATQVGTGQPDLNPGFPTFGTALADIVPAYTPSNILWFGKWHVSNQIGGANGVLLPSPPYPPNTYSTDTLPGYGFNTGRSSQILWPSYYGSPNGSANEGNNGYPLSPPTGQAGVGACDEAIFQDFVNNWTNHAPTSPWFACVSFVNPHDIHFYPGFFPKTTTDATHSTQNPNGNDSADAALQGTVSDQPAGELPQGGYQPHAGNYSVDLFSGAAVPPPAPAPNQLPTALPSAFNYESTQFLQDKSWDVNAANEDKTNFLQYYFQLDITDSDANLTEGSGAGHATVLAAGAYADFFNWYYYLLSLVDANIGRVLSTVLGSGFDNSVNTNPSANTAIIFLSDHGDFGGSHGIHAKAGAVYDETLRVPLYVILPSQQTNGTPILMWHMCSMVDIFKLVVELGLGSTTYNWAGDARYCDQAANQNQSILSFVQNPYNIETRAFQYAGFTYPYILTTCDEIFLDPYLWTVKSNPNPPPLFIPAPQLNPDCNLRNHIICIRTKSDYNQTYFESAYTGAKLAIYSKWPLYPSSYNAPMVDGTLSAGIVQDYEYYDYLFYQNRTEVSWALSSNPNGQTGSDYWPAMQSPPVDRPGLPAGTGANANAMLQLVKGFFGNMQILTSAGPPPVIQPATGIVANVLTRQLTGVYNSVNLSTLTTLGIQGWYTWLQGLMSKNTSCME